MYKLIIYSIVCYFWFISCEAVELAINHSVPKSEVMTREVVWAIFSREIKTWSDGTPTIVFVLNDDDPVHEQFTKQLLESFPYQLHKAWDRRVFSGTGQAPIEVNSLKEMFESIIQTPGSIGYLPDKYDGNSVRTSKVISQ